MKIDFEQSDIQAMAEKVVELLRPILSRSNNGKQNATDQIFDVKGLAEYLHVDTSWVYKKVSLKEIQHFKVGKYPRFKKTAIDQWLETRKADPVPIRKRYK